MKRVATFVAALAVTPSHGIAAESVAPLQAVAVTPAHTVLPQNTPVYLSLNETLNTKSSRTKRGNTFTLSVTRDVIYRQHVVIPRGSRAMGTIVYRTRKGGFGKSGKMEISLDYVEIGDQQIAIRGSHREEGEGNSGATVATFVLLSMIGSGLITGHSAEIPAGRVFTAWTKEDVPLQLIGEVPAEADPAVSPTPGMIAARPVQTPRPQYRPPINTAPLAFGNGRVRCDTCR